MHAWQKFSESSPRADAPADYYDHKYPFFSNHR